MTDRIEPPLTPEQWASALQMGAVNYEECVGGTPAFCAYLIALNNAALPDSDPRKITREWVAYLRRLAADCEAEGLGSDWQHDEQPLLALADALASYLPPD